MPPRAPFGGWTRDLEGGVFAAAHRRHDDRRGLTRIFSGSRPKLGQGVIHRRQDLGPGRLHQAIFQGLDQGLSQRLEVAAGHAGTQAPFQAVEC